MFGSRQSDKDKGMNHQKESGVIGGSALFGPYAVSWHRAKER